MSWTVMYAATASGGTKYSSSSAGNMVEAVVGGDALYEYAGGDARVLEMQGRVALYAGVCGDCATAPGVTCTYQGIKGEVINRLAIGGDVAAWLRCSTGIWDSNVGRGSERSKEGWERI